MRSSCAKQFVLTVQRIRNSATRKIQQINLGPGCVRLMRFSKKKNTLFVNVFGAKVFIGTLFLTSPTGEGGGAPYVVIRATRSSRRLQGKGSTFISQLF